MSDPPVSVSREPATQPLDGAERKQFAVLRVLGAIGGVLVLFGAGTPLGTFLLPEQVALPVSYTGMGLVVVCWLLVGRLATPWRTRRLTPRQIHLTLALWAVPFLFAVPLFSRDLYSYLAIGETIVRGIDPYAVGPVDALGVSDSIARLVDPSWLHTPTPYGPAFLLITQAVSTVVGHNLAVGVLVYRLIAVLGVLLIVWALPRLARICSFDPVTALWLGALNPLLLFHLIGGAHNEALMLGAMLAGLVIGIGRVSLKPETRPIAPDCAPAPPVRPSRVSLKPETRPIAPDCAPAPPVRPSRAWSRPEGSVALGAVIITAGVAVKATAALALIFLVIASAIQIGGRRRDLARMGGVVLVVSAGAFLVATVLAGWGWGWIGALSAPGTVTSFLSVTTQLGVVTTLLLQSFGLPMDPVAVVGGLQKVGLAISMVIISVLAGRTWRRTLNPILGLGFGLAAFVVLSPTVQQWYLLWAVLPIAAAVTRPRDRSVTMWVSAVVAMLVTPGGSMSSAGAILPAALCAAAAIGAVVFTLQRMGMSLAAEPPSAEHLQPDITPR